MKDFFISHEGIRSLESLSEWVSSLVRKISTINRNFLWVLGSEDEILCSSETSVIIYQSTQRNIPEDLNLRQDCYENLKSGNSITLTDTEHKGKFGTPV
jgi:hypothetical protein